MKIYLADETVHPDVKNALAKAVVGEVRRASFETERDGAKTQHNISCTIAAVEKVSFPSLDDEFARKLTKGKIQTIADFRTHIREDIQHYWNDVSDRAVMDALIGEIVRRHDFTAPESLVKAITDASIDDVKNQYPGKKLPTDFDEKKFREDFRASAIFQAKWYLIRERIIEIEKVQVEDADLERKAERDAATTAIAKERLISFYKNSKPVLDRILSDKLAAVLKSGATITEKAAEIPK
jgi:FKBP-type peptidyl-prolyl cis-trans isomerase (trigger factor)